ncbi:MAG TPA: hypothetical protein VGM37_07770 [Armatimonadota bacterium]|jgi:predicted transcriptional regulator
MARTLTLELDDAVLRELQAEASRTGATVEAVAEQAVRARFLDPLEKWIGALDSGVPDLATRHDHYLGEALENEGRRGPQTDDLR